MYLDDVLQYYPHEEGYVRQESNGDFTYVYQCKDHLGNVRLSYADSDGDGVITKAELIEESNYYPFGMQHTGYNSGTLSSNLGQKLKYNGKELQEELNLGIYDYGARNYDPAIGRWFNIDPMAEKRYSNSPFMYANNNPIIFVDPDGMDFTYTGQDAVDFATGMQIGLAMKEARGKKDNDDEYIFNHDGSFREKITKPGQDYIRIYGTNVKIGFVDPINDPKAIDDGIINKLVLVEDDAIENELKKSGVYDKENQDNRYEYIQNESNASSMEGTGRMDYVTHDLDLKRNTSGGYPAIIQISSSTTLFVTGTKSGYFAHNNYNFGNFLWGAGAHALGFSEMVARMGAHWNNYKNDPNSKGKLDSKDDQFSIHLGFEWNK